MTVRINGEAYEPRSLTMPEVREIRDLDVNDSDIAAISLSTGVPLLEVREWFHRVPMGAAQAAIDAVLEASALTEDAQFPDSAEHDAGDARPRAGD